ncbi:TrmH family RNA methyltransferase [Candidatus Margulisiibacteriota bacterium]
MISSLTNPKIKYVSSLKKGKAGKSSEFIIEGVHLAEEAVSAQQAGKCRITLIIYSKKFSISGEGSSILSRLVDAGIKPEEVSEKVIKHLTNVESPQGIVGVVENIEPDIGEFFNAEDPLILILDGLQDPGNLGTIIRSANAFGVSGIIMTADTVSPYNPKVIRGTAGAIFNIGLSSIKDLNDVSQALKRRGVRLIATTADAPKMLSEADLKGPAAIMIGNEGKGIRPENVEMADEVVSIPMVGETESLNAAVSASIVLYEVLRQRKAVNNG